MHLFTLSEFGARFGIDLTVSDFHETVVEASKAATKSIASMMRFNDFSLSTGRRDAFRCARMFGTGAGQNRQFVLSRGFIDKNSAFRAVYTANPVHVRNNETSAFTDLEDTNEDAQSDYMFLDANQGLLTVYGLDLTDQWVVVDYDSGFTVNNADEFQGVPGWLSEAAMAQAALYVKMNPAFTTENEGSTQPLSDMVRNISAAYGRYHLGAIPATMSEPGQ